MKKLILVVTLALSLTSFVACKNSPQQIIYKSESALITSVDTGMKLWHDYVVAGKATQAQVDAVKSAYLKYYESQKIAKAAIELYVSGSDTNSANASLNAATTHQAVIDAANALVNIISSFTAAK